jgi:hypothetical protein
MLVTAAQPSGSLSAAMEVRPDLEGLSLALCILDMAEQRVDRDRVARIVTRNKLAESEWHKTLRTYKTTVWKDIPKQAVALADDLRHRGKIVEQRWDSPDWDLTKGCWRIPPRSIQICFAERDHIMLNKRSLASHATSLVRGAIAAVVCVAACIGIAVLVGGAQAPRPDVSERKEPIQLYRMVIDEAASADARVIHELTNAYGAFNADLATAGEFYPDVSFVAIPSAEASASSRSHARVRRLLTVTRTPWVMTVVRVQNRGERRLDLASLRDLYAGTTTVAMEARELNPEQTTTVFLFDRADR